MVTERSTDIVPEVEVKVPPVKLKGPLISIVALPPVRVPLA
jgi:hypothetical protein